MHCRRVRSFLSAYSKGELSEKRSRAIADHLRDCPSCRSEESAAREIDVTLSNMSSARVSSDFNARLLDRIAKERFSETRSRAYLPKKRVPVVNLTRMGAVVAAACFVFAFIFAGGINTIVPNNDQNQIAESVPLNNDYQTVQPKSEHWVFKEQLQRATRIKNLMNRVTGGSQFNILTSQGGQGNYYNRMVMPIPRQFFQIQRNGVPFYNGTVLPETTMVREVNTEG